MTITETSLPGVIIIEPRVFADGRGFFFEAYHSGKFAGLGIHDTFVQDNQSRSVRGTVRGLHYQIGQPQVKLVRVIRGEVWDVAVDIRRGSPTFGQWTGVTLSEENRLQLYVPVGFAHGFSVRSAHADLVYKCSALYAPASERAVYWEDPRLGVDWRLELAPVLSERDARNPCLRDIPEADLPVYEP
jgi:dTDP-4-dehydrorhamnose 3,5-epimerase